MASNKKLDINQAQEHAAAHARSGDSYPPIEDGPQGGWANLTPKLKRAIQIGVALGLILLILLIVLIVVLAGGRCSFSSSFPGHLTPRSVYTKPDVSNLAKFAGYIHVYDLGFLALDIKRMTQKKFDNIITLEDDCVTLSLGYSKNNETFTWSIYQISWEFNNDANEERTRQPYEKCTADAPEFHHSFKEGYHYSCREREAHQCRKDGRDGQTTAVAELVIESFELELGGDDEIIYQGNFSKPPYPRSCDSYAATMAQNSTANVVSRTTFKPAEKASD